MTFAVRVRGAAPLLPRAGGERRTVVLWNIVNGRRHCGEPPEPDMSHQPPKESKKKAQHTAKEKKVIKQQKKQVSEVIPFIKH